MISCPECGADNPEGAKFCDRCGQGLSAGPAASHAIAMTPLAGGTELAGGIRILSLLNQSSDENLYLAERTDADGQKERIRLRERRHERVPEDTGEGTPVPDDGGAESAVPVSSSAKTADLKLKPSESTSSAEAVQTEAPAEGQDQAAEAPAAEIRPEDEPNGVSPNGALGEIHRDEEARQLHSSEAEASPDSPDGDANHEGPVPTSGETASPEPPDHDGMPTDHVPANGAVTEEHLAETHTDQDLGEVFGRVLALSLTLNHPAFERALSGFAEDGRVYLIYRDEPIEPLARRSGGIRMREPEALAVGIQLCQAVAFAHRRGLRVNDICPESVGYGTDRRIHLSGLDRISNDDELQTEPLFNDGYTAPEIYKGRKADKRADLFSIGALLYTCLTGERLEAESWREEAGPIRFYRPHVVTPALEQAVRRALMFDPAGRWPNVDALKAELVRLSGMAVIRASVLTDVGLVRELNEDAVMAAEYRRDSQVEPAQNLLYVIADGMGGAEAGEIASAIAVGVIRNYVEQSVAAKPLTNARQLLQAALEEANTRILDYQSVHTEARGMGSTAVSTLIVPPDAAVAWVGDSRAYLHDHNGLRQLTKDHSLVQRLIEIGQITPEEARHHEHKNVITRSLGARQSGPAGAESLALKLKRGDRLLMCSDGLTAHVDDGEIDAILGRHGDPGEAARELIAAANAGGGTDNISVVVVFAV
jgi:PPM family protein phosphatase